MTVIEPMTMPVPVDLFLLQTRNITLELCRRGGPVPLSMQCATISFWNHRIFDTVNSDFPVLHNPHPDLPRHIIPTRRADNLIRGLSPKGPPYCIVRALRLGVELDNWSRFQQFHSSGYGAMLAVQQSTKHVLEILAILNVDGKRPAVRSTLVKICVVLNYSLLRGILQNK